MYSKLILYISTILLCITLGFNIGHDMRDNEVKELREMISHLGKRIDTLLMVKEIIKK